MHDCLKLRDTRRGNREENFGGTATHSLYLWDGRILAADRTYLELPFGPSTADLCAVTGKLSS
jgi:hypothetical protein